jgi:hypothetical protein
VTVEPLRLDVSKEARAAYRAMAELGRAIKLEPAAARARQRARLDLGNRGDQYLEPDRDRHADAAG